MGVVIPPPDAGTTVGGVGNRNREISILVTGFGPFLDDIPTNPSYEIASRLPTSIPLPSWPKASVRIIVHAQPLRVSYRPIASLVPALLATHAPDLVLHIGLAAGREYYAVERSSARLARLLNPRVAGANGANGQVDDTDVDGLCWTEQLSDEVWSPAESWPDRLTTGLAFEGVWERWRAGCAVLDSSGPAFVRPSDSVGGYLCGFIYYTSLAWFWARERADSSGYVRVRRPVLFLHVPVCFTEADLEYGTAITTELIKAMAETWLVQTANMEAIGRGLS